MQPVPRTRRTPQNTQHTYTLSRRIHHIKTYPVQSPQGATILIYGHENGVTVVWRGGRRLKPPKHLNKEKRNGANNEDAVMVIDSDEETPASGTFVDRPEFEENPTANVSDVPEVVQTLDLALGTAALHVAVLPMPPCHAEDAAWNGAKILKSKVIFAVTCATADVYLVTLPLTPPSYESKARPELRQSLLAGNAGTGVWGETLTLLTGQSRPCGGLAITLVKPNQSSRSRSGERAAVQSAPITRAIVAAHSREASGTLRLWDVAMDAKPGIISRVEPFQTEYLSSPLTSISFNPTHQTQLLTIASSHAARIYDYATAALPSDDTSDGPFPTQGSWLLSLYPPFARGPSMSTARKPIVDAEWIAHGRAILVLLADGQWGIWDIDGASPSAGGSGGLFSKANSGLRGSAITNFCVSGQLEGTSPLRNPATQKLPTAPGGGEFVPMTPHTRRDVTAAAITGGSEKLAAVRGGITIAQLPSQGTGPGEESAVLWLCGADPIVSVIPVISKFWDSQLRRAVGGGVNLWSGAQPTRMLRLTDLSIGLLGERCTGAAAIPKSSRSSAATNGSPAAKEPTANPAEGLPVEVLLQGESRLVVVHESEDAATTASFTTRLLGARKKPRATDLGPTKAILAYPRPEKPNSVAFNLNIAPRAARPTNNLFAQPTSRGPSIKGSFSFDQSVYGAGSQDTVLPSTELPDEVVSAPSSQQQGLVFVNDLSYAADRPDDEFEAAERDIEQELMDIMEIDRELENLERERGTKRVFFEEG
ncbi:Nucleoporin Nup37 [Collariella sp. IMI 366227]|nr:Nucleoporin Nup37 [Collariella sp. IMI 366227]